MTELEIKFVVRQRDGNKCRTCGMTNEEHIQKYDKQLNVHRKVPGSVYSVEGCETYCIKCHKREHVRLRKPRLMKVVKADRLVVSMARMIAAYKGISLAEVLSEAARTPLEKMVESLKLPVPPTVQPRQRDKKSK